MSAGIAVAALRRRNQLPASARLFVSLPLNVACEEIKVVDRIGVRCGLGRLFGGPEWRTVCVLVDGAFQISTAPCSGRSSRAFDAPVREGGNQRLTSFRL